MAKPVRIIRGPRNTSFDHYIQDVIDAGQLRKEFEYFGIEDEERARYVRQKLRTAGTHMDPRHAVMSYWKPCPGHCKNGGVNCQWHVVFAVFTLDEAREYKARIAANASR